MVMVTAERLGDLETSELVFGHNSVHHACKFEYGEVSIRRTLRQGGVVMEDLRYRERFRGRVENLDEFPAAS